MNKALHVLVYVFLLLAAAALYFELDLNKKRSELTARNRMQEDYLVQLAMTIEKGEPAKDTVFELKKDSSPVEAREIDIPDTENVLEDYAAPLEQANLDTFRWDGIAERQKLRSVYVLDAEGKPVMDGNEPQKRDSEEDKMLKELFNAAKRQQERLNTTRAVLTELRGKLEETVNELNRLKPEARQDKATIVKRDESIAKLEEEKTVLEGQVTKCRAQIDELNGDITSKNDEIATLKGENEAAKEELLAKDKSIASLKQMLREALQMHDRSAGGAGTAVSSIPAGDKGKIIEADNENMFAIIEFTAEAMHELKGDDPNRPLPALELGVKRPGFNGAAGEFVGKIRLRQEVKGKNYVICDILGDWEQAKLAQNDVIFAD